MFAWGEDCQKGFRLKSATTGDVVRLLNLSFRITHLSAGHSAIVFTKDTGDAFVIRHTEREDGTRDTKKQKYVKSEEKIQAVSCGDDTVTLLSDKGEVLSVVTSETPLSPRTPEGLQGVRVCQIACGSQHSVALTQDALVYTWGQDSRGQLGLGNQSVGAGSPQILGSLSAIPVVQIAAGGEQSFALSVSGAVFSWGRNDHGQLGLGDTQDRHTPTPSHYLDMKKTVHLLCGKDHTVTLTKDGGVFTFGSGQYGQLGHNSFRDELRPRLVAELWGAKVIKIACGRHHTLVMTDCRRVYSFGRGERGQLGSREERPASVPLPVQLPQGTNNGLMIRDVMAGGDFSFAACSESVQEVHDVSNISSVSGSAEDFMDDMIVRWTTEPVISRAGSLEIHSTFSSASLMNQCFLDKSKDKHFQTSPKYSGLNLSLAQYAFKKLALRNEVLAEVERAFLQLLPSLERNPVGLEGLRIYLLLPELLHVIQKRRQDTTLALAGAAAILSLSAESRQIIVDWWSSLSPSTMVRHVRVWTKALSQILSSQFVSHDSGVRNLLLLLQCMYKANSSLTACQRIPGKTFHLELNAMFLQTELQLWRSMRNGNVNDQPLLLVDFMFVMSLKSKKEIFDISAECTKQQHQGPFGWFLSQTVQFELRLRRASLLDDARTQLSAAHPTDFKKWLAVYLDEDPDFTDVYKKDFFHHVFKDIVSPDSGLFIFFDSLAWFSPTATEKDEAEVYMLGLLCGLALYNQSIIQFPLPLALYKKLLDVKPTLEDLAEHTTIGKTLQDMLDYDETKLQDLDSDFSISWGGTEVELDPQNPGKEVTVHNKEEFVDAYVDYVFNRSVEGVFREFKRGFFQVCDRDVFELFEPEELQGVLVGQDVYNWAKLKQKTVYRWPYSHDHPTILMFWEVFEELTEDQKKDFLLFVTGFRRAPILGLGQVEMKVDVLVIESMCHDQHCPKALTCHCLLYLPVYSSKSIMRNQLIEALKPDRGFSM